MTGMARPREFDVEVAVEAAVDLFREHGFEGTSAQMLVDAMGIGRQSLYDTFGDKWGIYCAALRHYCQAEVRAHCEQLASGTRAIDGISAMLDRVVEQAAVGCLGLGSVVEFGHARPELVEIREASGAVLRKAMVKALGEARAQGDIAEELDLEQLTTFVLQSIWGIRLTARAGADQISAMASLTLRALR